MTRKEFFITLVGVPALAALDNSFGEPKSYPILAYGHIYIPDFTCRWDSTVGEPLYTVVKGKQKVYSHYMAYIADKKGYEQFRNYIEKYRDRYSVWCKENLGSDRGVAFGVTWRKADTNFVFSGGAPLAEVPV